MSVFSELLKDCRKRCGFTQRELANKLGVASSAVGMYEQGRREPDSTMLLKICAVLNTTTDYLLGLDDGKSLNQNENRNVSEVIDEFTEMLANQSGLMFDGEPITDDDRRKIIDAIRVAAAVAVNSRNRNGG